MTAFPIADYSCENWTNNVYPQVGAGGTPGEVGHHRSLGSCAHSLRNSLASSSSSRRGGNWQTHRENPGVGLMWCCPRPSPGAEGLNWESSVRHLFCRSI